MLQSAYLPDHIHQGTTREPERRIPSYRRILEDILWQINSGLLRPGDLVDSERKLAERYEVSLMTARHALSELATRNIVLRKPSGTVVASPQIQTNRLASYSEQMRECSVTVRSKVIAFMKVRNEAVAAQLCLRPGERITQIERLRLGEKAPLALETCYLSAKIASTWSRSALEQGSVFYLLRQTLKANFSHADEEVDAVTADTRTAHLLELAERIPLLRVRQLLYSSGSSPCLYLLGLYPANRHKIKIRRFR
jgi:GntR family transcriptional regulator